MSARLDVYVESARSFLQSDDYKLQHMLRSAQQRGLSYRLLDRPYQRDGRARAFLHVDLTTNPRSFDAVSPRYTACVNGGARTISRLLYSTIRVGRGEAYDGPVIVKTVLNHHGWPEFRFHSRRTLPRRVWHSLRVRVDKGYVARACPGYSVYPTAAAVPRSVWKDRRLMVERFLPGRLTPPIEKYRFDFFYDVELNIRSIHGSLLCEPETVTAVDRVAPVPDAVIAVRRQLHLDYGAIDYFIVDGVAIVIDANKTVGITPSWLARFPDVRQHVDLATDRLLDFANGDVT